MIWQILAPRYMTSESYNELLDLFDLPSHEDRRLHLKLGLLFKIVHGLCYYPDVLPFRVQPYSYRSNHSY